MSVAIAVSTAAIFAAFLWHAWTGGAYETRTMGAMILRLSGWIAIAFLAVVQGGDKLGHWSAVMLAVRAE